MMTNDARRQQTEALIRAIWGPEDADARPDVAAVDPATRACQNRELAAALKAYLQQYLTEM